MNKKTVEKQGNAKASNNHHNKEKNQSSQKVYSCFSFTTHFKVFEWLITKFLELNGSVNDLTKTINKKVYAALYSEFLNMV